MSRSHDVSVAEAQRWAREFVQERDWARFHNPRNLAMALSVESSELLELYLWSEDDGPQPINEKRKAQVAGEAADVFMCLLNFCDQAGIDLAKALEDKLVIARNKYPADRVKGSALKYDEYDEYDEYTKDG
ncbi:MAG: dCTP diphosphatase [Kiritimatiellia bacterium]|jgi:dCTP diphosphatase